MPSKPIPVRIGIYGSDNTAQNQRHGCGLWMAGYASCLTAAEAESIPITNEAENPWDEVLEGVHGVLLIGSDDATRLSVVEAESLAQWCRERSMPLLGVDHGLHLLNAAYGGTIYQDVGREVPEALQHRHPPEKGLRHAINVIEGTRLAEIYGEGEIVVNSEHRRAVQKIARGFRMCAHALDGVVEAIESVDEEWFAMGVQWHPASSTASGLDIQLFRGLIQAARRRLEGVPACHAA